MTGYLFITGLVFLAVGVRALLKPVEAVATPNELRVDGVNAKNYLRSGTGGVTIASGAVMVAACYLAWLAVPALVMAVTILGGLVAGRLVSVVLDGSPGLVPWISGAFELLGAVMGAFWLMQAI